MFTYILKSHKCFLTKSQICKYQKKKIRFRTFIYLLQLCKGGKCTFNEGITKDTDTALLPLGKKSIM